jgi:hypothetical protein
VDLPGFLPESATIFNTIVDIHSLGWEHQTDADISTALMKELKRVRWHLRTPSQSYPVLTIPLIVKHIDIVGLLPLLHIKLHGPEGLWGDLSHYYVLWGTIGPPHKFQSLGGRGLLDLIQRWIHPTRTHSHMRVQIYPNAMIPEPMAVYYARWGQDPLFRGSYSNSEFYLGEYWLGLPHTLATQCFLGNAPNAPPPPRRTSQL